MEITKSYIVLTLILIQVPGELSTLFANYFCQVYLKKSCMRACSKATKIVQSDGQQGIFDKKNKLFMLWQNEKYIPYILAIDYG